MLAKVIVASEGEGLIYLIATAVFLSPLVAARFTPRPFFGGLFALTLAPFAACAVMSSMRLQAVISYAAGPGRYDPENLLQKLHEVYAPTHLGIVTTAAALVLHGCLCFLTRRRPA